MTEFEKWLLGRINWTAKQLDKAQGQGNRLFEIIYQSGLDLLEEVHRVYGEMKAKAANGGRVDCDSCPYREKLREVKELVERL